MRQVLTAALMTDFKTKRIQKGLPPSKRPQKVEKPPKEPRERSRFERVVTGFVTKHFIWTAIIVVAMVGMAKATYNIVTLAEEISVKEIVLSVFSEKIQTDKENHTNILLLGTGGANHSGGTLTDTMIVASIDHDNDWVSMLSIPRDLWVETEELYGGNRINSIVELVAEQEMYNNNLSEEAAYQKGYEVLQKAVSEIMGIPIQYYAQVDFSGFVEIVDAIDGVDVVVENAIYDTSYPADNGSIDYQTFSIDEGPQHLDGATTLKYVRSRKSTSDFDRAARQQIVLQAIKEKALSLGVLTSPSKIKDIYDAIDSNFESNLKWDELVYLAKISSKFSSDNVSTWVLNDNPLSTGGFLYPAERVLETDPFLLLPYQDDFSDIKKFANLVLIHPEVHANPLTYQILNGTKNNGVATETLYYLYRFGFEVIRYGNAPNRETLMTRLIPVTALLSGQTLEDVNKHAELTNLLSDFIPTGFILGEVPPEYSPTEWETEADVIIELGQDYVDWMDLNRQYFY